MKSLRTLIKLHKNQLDEMLVKMNKLEAKKQDLTMSLDKIIKEAQQEAEKYFKSPYAYMLDNYLQQAEENKQKLSEQIEQVNQDILVLYEQLHDKFAELKKFEIALQNRLSEQQNLLKKAELKILDELNTMKFIANSN